MFCKVLEVLCSNNIQKPDQKRVKVVYNKIFYLFLFLNLFFVQQKEEQITWIKLFWSTLFPSPPRCLSSLRGYERNRTIQFCCLFVFSVCSNNNIYENIYNIKCCYNKFLIIDVFVCF